MHSTSNRQIRNPGPRGSNIVNRRGRSRVDAAEERKLMKLLGRHTGEQEKPNDTGRPPKLR